MMKKVNVIVRPVELRQRFYKFTVANMFDLRAYCRRMLHLYFLEPNCMSEDEADTLFQFMQESDKYFKYGRKESNRTDK